MTEIRGMEVAASGTYVLLEDVVTVIHEYAQSLDDPTAGAAIHALASWLVSGEMPVEASEVYGAESDDVTEGVARVEIYPDPPEDPRPKWYARTIDTSGFILKVTNGSFDQEWVIQNAQERFPGVEIFLLKNAGEDSKWTEDKERGVFPSYGPPIRRLWAGAGR